MKLRDHPKMQWPPTWSKASEPSIKLEEGIIRHVDLVEPTKLLLSNELDGKVYFAEFECFNDAFASRLREKIKLFVGRPLREVGEIDF